MALAPLLQYKDIFHHTLSFLLVRDIRKLWNSLDDNQEIVKYHSEKNILYMPHITKLTKLNELRLKNAIIEMKDFDVYIKNGKVHKIVQMQDLYDPSDLAKHQICICGLNCAEFVYIHGLMKSCKGCLEQYNWNSTERFINKDLIVGSNIKKIINGRVLYVSHHSYSLNPDFLNITYNCRVLKIYDMYIPILAHISAPQVQIIQFFGISQYFLRTQKSFEPLYKLRFPQAQFEYYSRGERYYPLGHFQRIS